MHASERAATIDALSHRLRAPLRRFFEKRLKAEPAEIDDLVQEVFLRLAAAERIRPDERLDGYVFQTAANLLRDRQRRLVHRNVAGHEPFDEVQHSHVADGLTPERQVLGQEAVERLIAALYGLPERTRNVWVLYHLEDLPHVEIARRLNIAQSTVEKHMSRANALLLSTLEQFR
jgi:RNA polymerase sigma-70 factor (ECF subfamily)